MVTALFVSTIDSSASVDVCDRSVVIGSALDVTFGQNGCRNQDFDLKNQHLYMSLFQKQFHGVRVDKKPTVLIAVDNSEERKDVHDMLKLRTAKRIACVGDSITWGYGATSPATNYPTRLYNMLNLNGHKVDVKNYGECGTTALRKNHYREGSYWNTKFYRWSLKWLPDVVIIMLGTNDSKVTRKIASLYVLLSCVLKRTDRIFSFCYCILHVVK